MHDDANSIYLHLLAPPLYELLRARFPALRVNEESPKRPNGTLPTDGLFNGVEQSAFDMG